MSDDTRELAHRISRLSSRESAELIDLVATRMAATERSASLWLVIRGHARALAGPPGDDLFCRVLNAVHRVTGISPSAMEGPGRTDQVVFARHSAMVFYREMSAAPTVEIGRLFGGRDHGTVSHAANALRARYKSTHHERRMINEIRADLGLPNWDVPVQSKPISSPQPLSPVKA